MNSGESGLGEGGVTSSATLVSSKVGMSGGGTSASEINGSGEVSLNSEGTGMSGMGPETSEVGVSRMGSAGTSTDSFFADFLNPRKPFFFDVVALGGGVAGTSSAEVSFDECFFSLLVSFFCF